MKQQKSLDMYPLKAHPWIGKEYQKGIGGEKVLVLGESHYCTSPIEFTSSITQDIIRDLFAPKSEHEPYKTTYTKFINALAGKKLDINGKRDWWNRIAFYNYVQTPMTGARVAPTSEDFKNSESAFFEVLEHLCPTHVIVWGKRLYENMPDCGKELPSIKMNDGSEVHRWEYLLRDGLPVKLLEVYHPSTGFSTDYWNEAIRLFLKE